MKAIIFGGTGFVGVHFARSLISKAQFSEVILVDIKPIDSFRIYGELESLINTKVIKYVHGDVNCPIIENNLVSKGEKIDLMANFAAIHREPGHKAFEYFNTNISGAENICHFADKIKCRKLLFSSSISPYGPSEESKTEQSLPSPETPYGSSKLVAEKIHQIWQAKHPENKLTIIRPGVIFGPGEGGNVSRMIKAIHKRYFLYMGNQSTRKAGIYIKELCIATLWIMNHQVRNNLGVTITNMSMNPGPSIKEYVNAVISESNIRRTIPFIPFYLVYYASFTVSFITSLLGIKQPINPTRIKKLVRSNNILPKRLENLGYEYTYTLESAFSDWRKELPSEWMVSNNKTR